MRKLGIPNLIPRPFPPPVFERLQFANTEGEGLRDLVMCDYIDGIDTWGVVSDHNNSHFASTSSWHYEQQTVLMLPCEHS